MVARAGALDERVRSGRMPGVRALVRMTSYRTGQVVRYERADSSFQQHGAAETRGPADWAVNRARSGVNELPSVALTTTFLALCQQHGSEQLAVSIVAAGRSTGLPGLPPSNDWTAWNADEMRAAVEYLRRKLGRVTPEAQYQPARQVHADPGQTKDWPRPVPCTRGLRAPGPLDGTPAKSFSPGTSRTDVFEVLTTGVNRGVCELVPPSRPPQGLTLIAPLVDDRSHDKSRERSEKTRRHAAAPAPANEDNISKFAASMKHPRRVCPRAREFAEFWTRADRKILWSPAASSDQQRAHVLTGIKSQSWTSVRGAGVKMPPCAPPTCCGRRFGSE